MNSISIVTGLDRHFQLPPSTAEGCSSYNVNNQLYKLVPYKEWERLSSSKQRRSIAHNPEWPPFKIWYDCWNTEPGLADRRFYNTIESLIEGYNRTVCGDITVLPRGWRNVLNRWFAEPWRRDQLINPSKYKADQEKIRARREDDLTYDKLKQKFDWFDHGLDFAGLKELNEWYENLRTWTDD